MRRKRLALLLAAALTVTSIDGTAFAVSGADFTSEPVEEAQADETAEVSAEEEQQETAQLETVSGETDETAKKDEATDSEELSPEEELTSDDSTTSPAEQQDAGEAFEFSAGEEAAFSAGEEETVGAIIPDTLQELTADQDYTVDITEENQEAWFSFTPQEDGVYSFSSEGDCDPKAYVYDRKDVTDKSDYIGYSDDKEGSSDFKLVVNMTKGKNYYFCAQLYSSDSTGSFTVRLEKQRTPSSVQINMDNVPRTEFMSDIDWNIFMPGMELTVDYGEGTEPQKLTFEGRLTSVTDSYEGEFSYAYRKSDEENTVTCEPGDTLSDGTWQIVILYGGSPIATGNTASFQVKTLENLPKLHEGEGNTIESPDTLCEWYTFTAPETADYTISPVNDIYVCTQEKYSVYSYTINNKCIVPMEKGQNYYIGLRGTRNTDGEDITQWDVSIEKKAEIASIKFSEKELVFAALKSVLKKNTPAGTLTINYTNGSSSTLDVTVYEEYSDKYGNRITAHLKDSEGEEVSWDYGEELPIGNYTLSYSVDTDDQGITTDDIPLTVRTAVFDDYPKIVLGENKVETQTYDESDPHYYGFEAEKDGIYFFDYKEYEDDWDYLFSTWYRFDDNGNLEEFDPGNDAEGLKLDKGKYIVSWFNEDYGTSATINVKYIPAISSVRVKSWKAYDSTIREKTGNAFLKELVVEVTYEDGTTKELKYNSDEDTDEYGRKLFYTFTYCRNEDGEYPEIEDPDHLRAGNYVYRVSVGDVFAEDIPFKVVSKDESVDKDLITGTNELKNQNNLLLRYQAPADGRYELAVNIPVTELQIQKADETELEYMEVTNYRTYTSFEKGETYYIYVKANEYCPELKVTVSALTRPEAMETTALKKNYIAGIEYFEDNDVQTKVSFEGQKTRIVRGTDVVEGYGLKYRVENSEGEEYNREKPLTVGTWTVTPYLSASAVDTADLPVKSETITVKKMDLNSLPKLNLDSWTEVADNMNGNTYYAFTAPEDGTYGIEREENENARVYGVFYKDGTEGYINCGYEVTLKKGETCLVAISVLGDRKVKVKQITEDPTATPSPTATPEPVTEIALTDGMKKDVNYTGNDIRCTFTPEEEGYYVLESSSWNEENVDTIAELFCEDESLGSDDDGGENYNFRLVWKLEAGKTYTYVVRTIGEPEQSVNFSLSFNKMNTVGIKDIEIISDSEEAGFTPGYSDSILRDVEYSYQLKFIYADGTSETRNVQSGSDKKGGNIDVNIETKDKPSAETVTFKITVIYKLPGQTDEEGFKKELTVTKKGLAAFSKIEANKDYPIDFHGQYYCFTPSEDGQYIVTGEDQKSGHCYMSMELCGEEISDGHLSRTYVDQELEGGTAFAVTLKAGRSYMLFAACNREVPGTIRIQKVKKTLKGLELVKAPEQTTCLPNDTNYVSLKGLQVKVLYTDGSAETITYGKTDSSGRQIYKNSIKWLADGSCIVYVNVENYQVGFNLKAASRDDVQELKLGKKITLNGEYGDRIILKFVPEYTGLYWLDVDNAYVEEEITGANEEDSCRYWKRCRLTAGKTYYFHIGATGSNPEVTINYKCTEHKWDEGKVTKEATCEADGEKTYTCSICGTTRTEVIEKTGHKFGRWTKVSDATVNAKERQKRTCSVCKKEEYREVGEKLKPTIKLNVTSITLQQKQSTKAVKVTMAKGDYVKSWSSNKKDIVTVDKNGLIRAQKKNGTAKITVTLQSGKSATLAVKVQSGKVATSKITGLKSSVSMVRGNSVTLKPALNPITSQDKITYSTSDKNIATVSTKGVIIGKKAGTAKITVKAGSKKAVVTVKVTPKVKTTKLSGVPKTKTISKGKSFTIKAVATPKNTEEKITYKSSNSKIATVTSKGVVKGIKKGTATITVQSGSKKMTCKVTVK